MMTITRKAEEKICELMQEDKETVGLRVYVKGGDCHGVSVRNVAGILYAGG